MYNWLKTFTHETNNRYGLAAHGATPEAIAELEAELGVTLPPSYKTFLQAWDGAGERFDFDYAHFLTVAEVIEENGYMFTDYDYSKHLIPIYTMLDSDYYVFDPTKARADGEYPVYKFYHDGELEDMRYYAPTFAHALMLNIYQELDSELLFDEDEDESLWDAMFEAGTAWSLRFKTLLEQNGADLSRMPHKSKWDDFSAQIVDGDI